jgi:hypothetical protein
MAQSVDIGDRLGSHHHSDVHRDKLRQDAAAITRRGDVGAERYANAVSRRPSTETLNVVAARAKA